MKRILCGAAALLLALLLCGQALAAASAEPVRIFVYEDTLYTYMELEGVDSPITPGGGQNRRPVLPGHQPPGDGAAGGISHHLPVAGGQFQFHAPLPGAA